MKKFKVAPQTAKRIKAIVAAAMALTLAVPTSTYLSSKVASKVEAEESVELPTPVMSVDFEKGFTGEATKNGLEVVKSDEVLKFAELKDDKGNYMYDPNTGYQIYDYTDKPFIEADEYKKGVVGNQPTTAYDAEMGNVLELDDTVEVAEFTKKDSDSLDSKYPIGTVLQNATTAQSQVKLNNPFAGKDFSETYNESTGWTKGVSISYWVKAPVDADGNGEDSNLIVFNNTNRSVMQKDDYAKYLACQNYSESDPMYNLGTQTIMTDADGQTYNVYSDYGCLIRMNPNYPLASDATVDGGWYVPTKASDAKIEVTDAEGKTYKIASLAMGTTVDTGLYESFSKAYAATDDDTHSSKSKIRQETIKGSMQISAQNDFHFREDNYRSVTTYDANGIVVSAEAVDGAVITNPNSAEYQQIQDFEGSNQFYFDGDETVTQNPTTWHFVTFVIQNDMVDVYVDGEFKDPEEFFGYCKDDTGESFSSLNAGKMFNQGRGIRGIFAFDKNNVAPWTPEGTAAASPANSLGITMLDWLSDADTELFIGGNGVAAACMSQDIGTKSGTYLDDLNFYDVPLTADEASALYAKAKTDKTKAVNADASVADQAVESFSFADGTMNGKNGTTMGEAPTNKNTTPVIASDASRGNVLQINTSKTSATSAVVLSKNPFAGKDLTGATVSYWVKEPAISSGSTTGVPSSIGASFADTKKVQYHEKISDTYRGQPSASLLWTTTGADANFYEGYTNGIYQSLKNYYQFSTKKNGNVDNDAEAKTLADEYTARINGLSDTWHMITVVIQNSGLYMYYDGVALSNNLRETTSEYPTTFGPRFYDGYYQRIYDGYKQWYAASNNQFATPLMTFLTDETTSAYIGYANKAGSETTFEKTYQSYFDDVCYFEKALSAEEITALYTEQKMTDVPTPSENPGTSEDPNNGSNTDGGNTNSDTHQIAGNVDEGGNVTFSYGGVTLVAPSGVIDASAELTLGLLGTSTDASAYTAMDGVLAKINDFAVKQYVLYTAKSDDGSVTPNGTFKLTFDIPSGYDATACVVVGEDGTVYTGTLTDNNTKISIETTKLGNYAVVEKDLSTDDGSSIAAATTVAGKTGDTANVVIPFIILALAGAAIVVVYKKKAVRN